MYHLIVFGNPEAYGNGPIILEDRARVLREYTHSTLSERYAELTEDAIAELTRLPALFAYERMNRMDARLGRITRIQIRTNGARISYEFDEELPAIPWERIDALEWELDISNLEMNRTHWALKDVNLLEVLAEDGLIPTEALSASTNRSPHHAHSIGGTIEVSPSVFRIPVETRQNKLVSVMMPLGPDFSLVHTAIGEVCVSLGLGCQRADQIFEESELIQDIFSLIYRSAVVICDLSDRNPNVYYETGIAHTLGRPVVPITRNDEHVSFDLKHHRFIRYENDDRSLKEFQSKLKRRLETLLRLPRHQFMT